MKLSSDVKLIAVHDKLDKKINNLQLKHGVDGATGDTGPQGSQGPQGPQGVSGLQGPKGANGIDGKKGLKGDSGEQGVSIEDASVDIDGNLTIKLSDGNEIDAGGALGGAYNNNRPLYATGGSTKVIDPNANFQNPVITYVAGKVSQIAYSNNAGTSTATKVFAYDATTLRLDRITSTLTAGGSVSVKVLTFTADGQLTSIANL